MTGGRLGDSCGGGWRRVKFFKYFANFLPAVKAMDREMKWHLLIYLSLTNVGFST